MVLWLIALVLLLMWLAGVWLGKGGFIHLLLLCAIGVAFVQFVADRRAAQD